jgi:hypothetical protein
MRKRISLLVAALMLALTMSFGSVAAFAASPSQEQCEAQGGTFTKERGEVQCVIVEEGKNPKFQQEETTTGRGNIENKQQKEEECNRPGQTEKCPPGQF